jgi:chromosome partitioning protein
VTQIAAVGNQKGGVGKTTLTINLGAAFAHMGAKVLLVDLDAQGHLTEGVGMQERYLSDDKTLYQALVGKSAPPLADLIHAHPTEPFDVIPATFELMLAEQALYLARNREHKLKNLLSQINDGYDWVLLDCPPVLGNLTDNALNAAGAVIIPIQAEATSIRALDLLFDQIESIEKGLSIHIEVLAVVPNLVQDSALSKKILSDLRGTIPMVTPFEIRKRVMLQQAWSMGQSIFSYQTHTAADEKTRREIADNYLQLASFIESRVKTEVTSGR